MKSDTPLPFLVITHKMASLCGEGGHSFITHLFFLLLRQKLLARSTLFVSFLFFFFLVLWGLSVCRPRNVGTEGGGQQDGIITFMKVGGNIKKERK